ncbi:putative leucine--tRNA ligase [Schistosoma japonicum]|uniref:leucine--tRNA ligase n=1 Tax=Schistosoma japonicum TaxID=6182 RepID=A0A4Z2D8S1_SCHJA|nr:putative leucine--tRNA ligase [Schistosoma japonicum]
MSGELTICPMGWDSFGLPAENAAIDRNEHPLNWTRKNIMSMKQQINETMSLSVDWSRELSTCDPNYYKWTQWLFLKLYQSDLAYHRPAYVNWDPIDKTVLADELIDNQGCSWRSGAKVERRPLRQWFFRTTVYSESLLDGLKDIENNQWRDVVQLQRGWLGHLNGTQMEFNIYSSVEQHDCNPRHHHTIFQSSFKCEHIKNVIQENERLAVFTKYPNLAVADLVSHIRVGPDSVYFADIYRKGKLNNMRPQVWISGEIHFSQILDISVRHPFTGRSIPMIRENIRLSKLSRAYPNELVFSLNGRTSDCISELLDIPLPPGKLFSAEKDLSNLSKSDVISEDDLKRCVIFTPISELHGKTVSESMNKAMQILRVNKRGGYWCSDERTDWLVSRQRYWGTPIPIIHCDSCGAVPVPEDQLPVLLPPLENPLKRGDEPLKHNESWRKTTCPKCGKPASRETDTLDTFVDSSWYYLRYLDPQNNSSMCDWKKAANSLPVDVYIGGAEHAVRHLYYARFIAHFLHDISILPSREPFRRFLPVGLVLGQTYVDPETGRFISTQRVNKKHLSGKDVQYYEVETNTPVQMYWDKMSKSKFNGIDPSEVVDKHGMDTVRLTMLANVGPHRTRKWTEGDVLYGINNWLNKISRLIEQLIEYSTSLQNSNIPWELKCNMDDPLLVHTPNFFKYHQSIIKRVNGYYDDTFVISSAIARLQEMTELLRKSSTLVGGPGPSSFMYLRALADLLVMLAPVAPIYASELWSGFQLACLPPAHKNLHQILSLHSNKMVTETSSYSSHWPYDLTKYVLQQPFPKFVSFTETSEPISVHEGLLQIEDV